ncbi:MAG: hypothetical protein ABS77_02245 [Phenylobacterium sp. SCN 69-14]|nr:MAG: hypothetical protein ABS77_02245 [Phenylobacterium sp. SCN 69-14]
MAPALLPDRPIGSARSVMSADKAIYVSKRLQRAAFALLCLLAAQLVLAVASCEPEPAAMGAARISLEQPNA